MLGWIKRLMSARRSVDELRRVALVLEEENGRLRGEITTLRTLCRALRDVNADLDKRLLEAES